MDKTLIDALKRDEAGDGTGAPAASLMGLNAAPLAPAPDASAYGLDASGDFDLAALESSHVLALQQQLDENPERVLEEARALWDSEISETELRDALEKTRAYIEQPELASAALRSLHAFETVVGMPPGFGFEGYDATKLPISPMETKFETLADAAGYAASFVAAKLSNAFKPKPQFPRHSAARPFVYDFPDAPASIGVLADFGNGLSHSRYIARHLRATKLDHVLYLGDVYYCGTSSEFARFVAPEMEDFLTGNVAHGNKVNVLMLNSNHEMFSKGYSYFSYMAYRRAKGAPQVQEGSYFAARFGSGIQVVGIDTDYFGGSRFRDEGQRAWLSRQLAEGRARGAFNILVSANEPYTYGKDGTTKLYEDMKPFLSSVDLWLWGNTHYCGFFDRTSELPMASCLGHGGYPYKLSEYKLDRNPYFAACPASPLFLETRSRYHGTTLRSDLGNNGYAVLTLEPASRRVVIDYIDWRRQPRYRAVLGLGADGRGALIEGKEL